MSGNNSDSVGAWDILLSDLCATNLRLTLTSFFLRSGDCTSWFLLVIKPTRCTNFSNLFLKEKSTRFGQFLCPSSGVFHCTHSSGICHTGLLTAGSGRNCSSVLILLASRQKTCMTYTIAVYTVKNSWLWTEELSETCRLLFQKYIWEISASSWFYYKKKSIWPPYSSCKIVKVICVWCFKVLCPSALEDNAPKFPGSVMPINLNSSVFHYRHSIGLVLGPFLLEAS